MMKKNLRRKDLLNIKIKASFLAKLFIFLKNSIKKRPLKAACFKMEEHTLQEGIVYDLHLGELQEVGSYQVVDSAYQLSI